MWDQIGRIFWRHFWVSWAGLRVSLSSLSRTRGPVMPNHTARRSGERTLPEPISSWRAFLSLSSFPLRSGISRFHQSLYRCAVMAFIFLAVAGTILDLSMQEDPDRFKDIRKGTREQKSKMLLIIIENDELLDGVKCHRVNCCMDLFHLTWYCHYGALYIEFSSPAWSTCQYLEALSISTLYIPSYRNMRVK